MIMCHRYALSLSVYEYSYHGKGRSMYDHIGLLFMLLDHSLSLQHVMVSSFQSRT